MPVEIILTSVKGERVSCNNIKVIICATQPRRHKPNMQTAWPPFGRCNKPGDCIAHYQSPVSEREGPAGMVCWDGLQNRAALQGAKRQQEASYQASMVQMAHEVGVQGVPMQMHPV